MKKISIISILAVGAIGVGVYFIYKKNKANAAAKKAAAAAAAAAAGTTNTNTNNNNNTNTTNGGNLGNTTTDFNSGTFLYKPNNAEDLTTTEKSTILKKGSTGKLVKILQRYLNYKEPANALTVDGNFGDLTENKLIDVLFYTNRPLGALPIISYDPNNFIGYNLFGWRT
jgi:hypothetical protein